MILVLSELGLIYSRRTGFSLMMMMMVRMMMMEMKIRMNELEQEVPV